MKSKLLFVLILMLSLPGIVKAQEVFIPNSKGGIESVPRAVVMGTKTGGNALLAGYGAKLTTSLVLDGKYSNTIIPRGSTVFYIFNPKQITIQAWKLVQLKNKKKNRELPYMKTGAYTGSKTSLKDIQLFTQQITDEVYEVRPMGDLKTGDYAIFLVENGIPVMIYDFRVEEKIPPYPSVSRDVVLAEFRPDTPSEPVVADNSSSRDMSSYILRWFFDSDPRGARIFYRVISSVPSEVKNTNESYMTTTPLEETKAISIPGLTYENAANVVIEIKVSKRGYEDQIKRYNVRQAIDQQEISGFFELVEKIRN